MIVVRTTIAALSLALIAAAPSVAFAQLHPPEIRGLRFLKPHRVFTRGCLR